MQTHHHHLWHSVAWLTLLAISLGVAAWLPGAMTRVLVQPASAPLTGADPIPVAALTRCPARTPGPTPAEAELVAWGLAERLATTWTQGDLTAALDVFAADAVVEDAAGTRWEGQTQLPAFLEMLWHPDGQHEPSRIQTRGRCAVGNQLNWLFTYTSTGAVGSLDFAVQAGKITHALWVMERPAPSEVN